MTDRPFTFCCLCLISRCMSGGARNQWFSIQEWSWSDCRNTDGARHYRRCECIVLMGYPPYFFCFVVFISFQFIILLHVRCHWTSVPTTTDIFFELLDIQTWSHFCVHYSYITNNYYGIILSAMYMNVHLIIKFEGWWLWRQHLFWRWSLSEELPIWGIRYSRLCQWVVWCNNWGYLRVLRKFRRCQS